TVFVPVEGDVNYDGVVNNADLLEVLFNFGSTGCSDADINGDGTVNNADLLIVLFNFGRSC
ncbi:MAG: dockerin type I domain-containing protein, partial [Fimbriimonadales bacterium]|nr:dockerin type I domain-containing protein [Fimbriimonadales bacterium]